MTDSLNLDQALVVQSYQVSSCAELAGKAIIEYGNAIEAGASDQELDEACGRSGECDARLEEQARLLSSMPARTFEGLAAKAKAWVAIQAQTWSASIDWIEDLGRSVALDAASMTA